MGNEKKLEMRTSLTERIQNLERLLEVSEAVISTLDLDEILGQITKQAAKALKATRVVLFLHTSPGDDYVTLVSEFDERDLPPAQKGDKYYFSKHTPTKVVMETKQTFHFQVDDPNADIKDSVRESLQTLNVKSVLMVPLIDRNRAIGLFAVDQADIPHQFTDDEIRLAKIFANQATIAMRNAELFESVQREKRQIEAIIHSSLDGILVVDENEVIRIFNPSFARMFGVDSTGIIGTGLKDFLAANGYTMEREQQIAAQTGEHAEAQKQKVVSGRHNRYFDVVSSSFSYQDEQTSYSRLLVFRDMTQEENLRQMKEDLTHMVVHDLKNPLTATMAYIESIMSGVLGETNEKQYTFLERAYNNSKLLLNMIADILDIYRAEEKDIILRREPRNIINSMQKALNQIEGEWVSKRLKIEKDFDSVAVAPIDEEIMIRVCINLLHNAFKFSPSAGKVTLRIFEKTNLIHVQVADQGPGIPEQFRDRVFEKFTQVGDAGIKHRMSSGLGLTFCKLMVNAHGGDIWVECESGKGSTFTFTIPTKLS